MKVQLMSAFVSGALALTLWLIGRYFWRFYRETRDRFFILFAWAFWLMAFERFPLIFFQLIDESRALFFVMRLLAFALILVAIIDKNRNQNRHITK